MTLYELTNSMTIQGNICIKIFDLDGREHERRIFKDRDDFTTYHAGADDLDDLEIIYMYAGREHCETWLNIELQAPNLTTEF